MLSIVITNRQSLLRIDKRLMKKVIGKILADEEIETAEIGVAVVDDAAIARIHAEYLDDNSPTDAISFVLESSPGRLDGEIAVSAETAIARAPDYGWPPEKELLLYVVHGVLHLVGFDDTTPKARAKMRKMERRYMDSIDSH